MTGDVERKVVLPVAYTHLTGGARLRNEKLPKTYVNVRENNWEILYDEESYNLLCFSNRLRIMTGKCREEVVLETQI
jgi:hypothetical protein